MKSNKSDEMRNDIKISIIVPVYNAEKYIEEALDSIKKQTLRDYEVILVDDGSKDRSAEICHMYCENDKRFQVIHQVNSGAAIARNNGAKRAKGKYIIFLDADDVFEFNFLEKMYATAEGNSADVCICGWTFFSDTGDRETVRKPHLNIEKDDEFFLWYQGFNPWSKLCRRDFLIEKNICFQNLTSSNDVYYSICVLLDAEPICYIEDSLIRYRTSSAHQISANRNPINLGYACKLAMERYRGKSNLKKRIQIFIALLLAMRGECTDNNTHKQLRDYIMENIIKDIECENIDNKTIKKIILLIKEEKYDMDAMKRVFSFKSQLYDNREVILRKLKSNSNIYLWGLGARGNAFQEFCEENNIHISAIADSKNINVGKENEWGNLIIDTSEMLKKNGLIIACNDTVYKILVRCKGSSKIVNLQNYCFL